MIIQAKTANFELYKKIKHDVVITDISMPHLSGHEMIKAMHRIAPNLPIIVMTSHDSSENILKSIDEGVYSYLRKPIKIEDLQLALLMATKDIYNKTVFLNDKYKYDCSTKELFYGDEVVNLTKTEQDLLYLLVQNLDKVISYETIENYVWNDKSMSREALRMCIKKIRAKTYPKIIQNVWQQGYKMTCLNG